MDIDGAAVGYFGSVPDEPGEILPGKYLVCVLKHKVDHFKFFSRQAYFSMLSDDQVLFPVYKELHAFLFGFLLVLGMYMPFFQGADPGFQENRFYRRGDKIIGAGVESRDLDIIVLFAGEDDDERLFDVFQVPDVGGDGDAVLMFQVQLQDHDADAVGMKLFE